MDKIKITVKQGRTPNHINTDISLNGIKLNNVKSYVVEQQLDEPTKVVIELSEPDLSFDFISCVETDAPINWKERYK